MNENGQEKFESFVFVCLYRSFLQKDKNLLKTILLGMQSQRPGEVQTVILRKHLRELTESFMIPLERYLASLMPLQKNICPCKVIFTCYIFIFVFCT
jgi:hypothetical protein